MHHAFEMVEGMTSRPTPPTSPHLTLWRWGIAAIASITHRITGFVLYGAMVTMMFGFVVSLALGPASYASFRAFAGSWFGQLILVGVTWSLFQHLASGLRHLLMDGGLGFAFRTASRTAAATFICSTALTAALWAYIWSP
jgi:succinate dehydrogenase / fumarate reductase cytochrome b subunit